MYKKLFFIISGVILISIAITAFYTLFFKQQLEQELATLEGSVTYFERIALPEGSVIEVRLEDTSRVDAPAIILAETTITTEGENVPVPFTLTYDPTKVEQKSTYSVRASILIDGELRFTNTSAVLVLTNNNPTSDIEVLVSSVQSNPTAENVSQNEIAACTMDVKECSDGSFVSRAGPSCEFAVCPIDTKDKAAEAIIGTKWVWQYTKRLDGSHTTPNDSSVFQVQFAADGKFSSGTDCNTLVGNYIVNNEILSIGPIAATKKFCGGDTRESIYSTELSRATSHVIDGNELRINLLKDSGTMIFARVPASTLNLNGTNFRLLSFNDKGIPAGTNYTLLFNGTSIQARFCNGLGGEYSLKNNTLSAPLLIGTLMFCEDPKDLMDMEQSFASILEDGAILKLDNSTLTLSGKDKFVFTVFMD